MDESRSVEDDFIGASYIDHPTGVVMSGVLYAIHISSIARFNDFIYCACRSEVFCA